MISTVLFDLDGTLIEFNFDYGLARRIVVAKLVKIGVDREILSESKPTSLNVEDAISFMRGKGLSEDKLNNLRSEVYGAVEPLELEAASNPVLRKGIVELLSTLKELNVKMAVCTNNSAKASEIILRKTSLKRFFNKILTRNDVEKLKPFPDLLVKACDLLKTSPAETVHVGDAPIDIMAARNAGVKPIGIVSGLSEADRLRNAGADLVASNVEELREILLSLI